MWAALLPLQPPRTWPPNAASTSTKPPLRRRSVAVQNFQNREEISGLVQAAVITSLKTNEPDEQQRKLIGADVLTALQRATAHKAKKKKERKIASNNSAERRKNQGRAPDFSIKPLCIKPEWSDRLEELEERLQQLAHS